jgi:uncharacterized protein YjbI with pentapeptide repeats
LVLGALGIVAIWFVPRRQARRWRAEGIAGKELAELETSARATLIQVVGAAALILTFVATWMQISDARKASERTLRLTSAQQEAERFTTGVAQLADDRREIQIGGIYGLEGVAAQSPRRRGPVAQILLTYLQKNHRRVQQEERELPGQARDACSSSRVALSSDAMQAALSVVVGLADAARPRYKLTFVDLQAVDANDADFQHADLTASRLVSAQLSRARFDGATLIAATFRGACLRDASFAGVRTGGASFVNADLSSADLSNARLVYSSFLGARLRGADLRNAGLRGAVLRDADLANAKLQDTDLRGADLRGANLSGTAFRQGSTHAARIDVCTRLPWRPKVHPRCPPARK